MQNIAENTKIWNNIYRENCTALNVYPVYTKFLFC